MLWHLSSFNIPRNRIVVELARKATALRPEISKNWERLAGRLLGMGEYEDAIAVLVEAVSKFPTEPRLHLILSDAYYQARHFDLAREVLDRAPAVPIDDRAAIVHRFELLMTTKAAKDIGRVAIETLAFDPTNITALRVLGNVSRKNGIPEIMISPCNTALKHEPGHTQARYELAVAFMILGRSEEARGLINLDQFITVSEVVPPQCYTDGKTFEATLVDEITGNPTLRPDPLDRATKGGLQTMDGLPHAGERAVGDAINLIRLAVDAFEGNLTEELDDPFVKTRPRRAWLNAWAIVYPSDGHQVAHMHAAAWLSGVYYVSVPKMSSDDQRNGCLVLGAMEGLNIDPPWGIRDIRPAPNRLVLFPSYTPHATVPTGANDRRICIAFNVVPIGLDP